VTDASARAGTAETSLSILKTPDNDGEQPVVVVPGVDADGELPQQLAGLGVQLDEDAGLAGVDDDWLPVRGGEHR